MGRARLKVFLDTSALIAGIASSKGAAREVLRLAETGLIEIYVSRQVIVEADRNIEAKLPEMLDEYRKYIKTLSPKLTDDPTHKEVKKYYSVINADDAPILAAAVSSKADCLVTWDKRHFMKKDIRTGSDLKIFTPGEFLRFFRECIED
jgi:putative PIN family toxin of toxin-antitoxin system